MKTTQLIPSTDHIQNGETWIGGPTYGLQRQHIPGYQGHISGLKSESVHSKTFAKVSAECLESRMQRGIVQEKDERFSTNYRNEFGAPNQRKPSLQTVGEKLLQEAKQQELIINEMRQTQYEKAPKSLEDIPPIDRLPVIGYQGFRAVFRHPLKKVVPPPQPEPYVHPLSTMDQEFAKTLLETNNDFRQNFEPKQAPIVGYTGFMKGTKAENIYGSTFRDISTKIINQ